MRSINPIAMPIANSRTTFSTVAASIAAAGGAGSRLDNDAAIASAINNRARAGTALPSDHRQRLQRGADAQHVPQHGAEQREQIHAAGGGEGDGVHRQARAGTLSGQLRDPLEQIHA
jgi:hypothetical protein